MATKTNPVVKSSSSNLELGVGHETNTPSPLCGSNPTNSNSTVSGVVWVNELRRSPKKMGWVQGRPEYLPSMRVRNHHQLLGGGAGGSSSATDPNQLVHASSISSSPNPNANELVVGTVSAKELLRSQILFEAASIRERLRSNLNLNLNLNDGIINIPAPSPGLGRGLGLHKIQTLPFNPNPNPTIPIVDAHNFLSNHSSHQTPTLPFSNTILITHLCETTNPSSTPNKLHNIKLTAITNEVNKKKKNKNKHSAADADADADADDQVNHEIDNDDNDDGRMHSFPYKKNGPYTCPKCKQEFPTSQHFASHVGAKHYKYETKAERRKRLMAKIRRKSLRLQQLQHVLTCLPLSSSEAAAGNSHAPRSAVKVEVDEESGLQDQVRVAPPPPPAGKEPIGNEDGLTGVKIKDEPYA